MHFKGYADEKNEFTIELSEKVLQRAQETETESRDEQK